MSTSTALVIRTTEPCPLPPLAAQLLAGHPLLAEVATELTAAIWRGPRPHGDLWLDHKTEPILSEEELDVLNALFFSFELEYVYTEDRLRSAVVYRRKVPPLKEEYLSGSRQVGVRMATESPLVISTTEQLPLTGTAARLLAEHPLLAEVATELTAAIWRGDKPNVGLMLCHEIEPKFTEDELEVLRALFFAFDLQYINGGDRPVSVLIAQPKRLTALSA